MKPYPLRRLCINAAAAASFLCWYLLRMEPDPMSRTAGKGMAAAAQVTGKGAESKPAEPWPKVNTPEFKSALKTRGGKWLDSHGRRAEDLVALWNLTGDMDLLEEASEKFPDNPRVCMAMIQALFPHDALPWIERLIAAEPANYEGLYQKAFSLMKGEFNPETLQFGLGKDRAEAISALRQAASMNGSRNDHLVERIRDSRMLAINIGVGDGDAIRLALDIPLLHNSSFQPLETARDAIMEELTEARAAGSEERVQEIIRLGFTTAERFLDMSTIMISDQLSADKLKMSMLEGLPDYTDIGKGHSAGQARAEIEERRRHAAQEEITDAVSHLSLAGDREMEVYFNFFTANGQQYALSWLLRQSKDAKW